MVEQNISFPPTSRVGVAVASPGGHRGLMGHIDAAGETRRGFLPPKIVALAVQAIDAIIIAGPTAIFFCPYKETLFDLENLQREGAATLLIVLVFSLAFKAIGGYQPTKLADLYWQITRIGVILTIIGSVLPVAAFVSRISATYSAEYLVAWIVAAAGALVIDRTIVSTTIARWARQGRFAHNLIIVGAGEPSERLVEKLLKSPGRTVVVRGVFDDRQSRLSDALRHRVLGSTDALLRFARRVRIDEVIITLPLGAERRIKELIDKLSPLAVDLHLSAEPIAEDFGVRCVSYVDGVPLLGIVQRPFKNWNAVVKWLEDKVLGGILLVLLGPLMALIALLIKLESRGPVLFRQERYGFNNNIIKIMKFRTMYAHHCDPSGAQRTVQNDPRVTRIGRILRSLSLDELPQLFNVLKGDMSLVGPRPHAVPMMAGTQLYGDVVKKYAHRHRVKPGITGWAQVNGNRGEIKTIEKAHARVELDLTYIERWSPWLDLKILARTVPTLLQRRDAY